MAIGTSDGEHYADRFDYLTRDWQEASNYPNPFEDVGKYTPTPLTKPQEPNDALKFWEHPSPKKVIPIREGSLDPRTEGTPEEMQQYGKVEKRNQILDERKSSPPVPQEDIPARDFKHHADVDLDNQYHIPLLASAKVGPSGEYAGLYLDHRATNLSKKDAHLLDLHERTELPIMQDHMKAGMKAPEAYAEAHKIATAVETARSRAMWGDAGHEAYQARIRDAVSLAKEPTDKEIPDDAHTSLYKLDLSELGLDKDHPDYHHERALVHLATNLFGPQHPILPINPLEAQEQRAAGPNASAMPAPKITVKRVEKLPGGFQRYAIHRDGAEVGTVRFSDYGGGHYHLGWAGGVGGNWSNDLGTSVMRQAFRQFIKDNPNATRLSAYRISGGRRAAGQAGEVDYDIVNGKLKLRPESVRDPEQSIGRRTERLMSGLAQRPYQDSGDLTDIIRELEAVMPANVPGRLSERDIDEIRQRYARLAQGDETAARYYNPRENPIPDRTADRFLNTGAGMMAGGLGAAVLGDTDRMEGEEDEMSRRNPFISGTFPIRYLMRGEQ